MQNILYTKTIKSAARSQDGETPTQIVVTQEVNGFAVFLTSFEEGCKLLEWHDYRNEALEAAVDTGRKLEKCSQLSGT